MATAINTAETVPVRSAPWRWTRGLRWLPRLLFRRWLVGLLAVAGVGTGLLFWFFGSSRTVAATDRELIYYTVQCGNLSIAVTERGNLESQQNVQVLCEVDDLPNDGINGTLIVWVIPNGASVKKGDLLVELDSSHHQERLDLQILDTERARATQIQAQAKHDNQITQNETALADARLKIKLAELDLKMFRDEQSGTYKLAVQEIERLIDDANNEILAAKASLELKRNDKRGIESLYQLGYTGKSDVERTRLEFLQAEGTYEAKVNRLQTQLGALTKKKTYEHEMSLLTLQGALETAKRKLVQVERDNEAQMALVTSTLKAANESLKKEEERLSRFREQITKCKIYAPEDGMVAYALSANPYYREDIREGVAIRPRQPILSLPNLKNMQVKTSVHESVLDQIHSELLATIRVDAFPDRLYHGRVKYVAVMPDQGGYLSADTKVYETIVTITEDVEQLKPGMTAVVEIHVDELRDVLSVPVQAIVQVKKDSWCYLDHDGVLERRPLKLGRTNDKFVEIRAGLEEGDRIVLNPMAIADESNRPEKQAAPEKDEPREGKPNASPEPEAKRPAKPQPEAAPKPDRNAAAEPQATTTASQAGKS